MILNRAKSLGDVSKIIEQRNIQMFKESQLQPADILLSTGNAKVSSIIRGTTGSNYSHASLYIGHSSIIEAVGDGIQQKTLRRAMSDDTLVAVYRRLNMTAEQGQRVINYARKQIGKDYDAIGAAGAGITSPRGIIIGIFLSPIITSYLISSDIKNRTNPEAAFYCSELVALAFQKAGVPLGSGAASSTPEDINRSHYLNYMGNLKN